MLIKRAALIIGVALVSVLLTSTASAQPTSEPAPQPPANTGTGAACIDGACGVGAAHTSTSGSTEGSSSGADADTSAGTSMAGGDSSVGGGSSATDTSVSAASCNEQPMNPQPAEGTAWWDGHSSSEGQVMLWVCTNGMTAASCTYCTVLTPHFVANGAGGGGGVPAPPPPPSPEELAQQAYQLISMPDPVIHLGPDDTKIAVKYWTYLWVQNPGPVSATVTAGPVSVTATATMTSVTWSMGEPVSPENLSSRAAPVTCEGTGADPGPTVDITKDPAPGTCAYMFKVRSTASRTGGSGTWPVTATANWRITWTANTGESGVLDAPPRVSVTDVSVGAWSTVIVANGVASPTG